MTLETPGRGEPVKVYDVQIGVRIHTLLHVNGALYHPTYMSICWARKQVLKEGMGLPNQVKEKPIH